MCFYPRYFSLVLISCALVIVSSAHAAQPVPAPPTIAAKSYLLMDFNSGHLLAGENIDTRLEPASLTKMMTAYIVYDEMAKGNLSQNDTTVISEKAWRMGGSRMFIEVGKQVKIDDLIGGLIVQSGNDASVALAEAIAGSEEHFADYMNRYATQLGMAGSNFVNSTGLPHEAHYTTARDISLLAQALIRDFPEKYKRYAKREFTFNNIRQYNRNKLLWRDQTVDGIKTGHTESAGYGLTASAKRDDMRIISVVLGAKSEQSRASESQKLLEYGFRFFKTHRVYQRDQVLDSPRVWKGALNSVDIGLANDLYVTVPRDQQNTLKTSLKYSDDIVAPIESDQDIGTLTITVDDEVIAERTLVALTTVAEGNIFQRLFDTVLRYFH